MNKCDQQYLTNIEVGLLIEINHCVASIETSPQNNGLLDIIEPNSGCMYSRIRLPSSKILS